MEIDLNLAKWLEIKAINAVEQLRKRLNADSTALADYSLKPNANQYLIKAREAGIKERLAAITELEYVAQNIYSLANGCKITARKQLREEMHEPKHYRQSNSLRLSKEAYRHQYIAEQKVKWNDHF